MDIIQDIINKNTIITANPGGGSTSFLLYLLEKLCDNNNILYYNTGYNIDREFVKSYYPIVYNNCFFILGTKEIFFNYVSNLGPILENFDYIIIDTADVIGKEQLQNIKMLLDLYNINIIVTSQLRVNPGNGKPYSTVEEWNKQISEKIFENSIWIRNVNEPNNITRRKYIDIYSRYRVGNRHIKRYILNFDKKRGNVI